ALAFTSRLMFLGRRRKKSVRMNLRGLAGHAVSDLDPNGAVSVAGDLWPAQALELIRSGERVKVTGYHGVALSVARPAEP
ncbi:MAG TPA: NfeD family protein, partial [Blastocatellia bacterium]